MCTTKKPFSHPISNPNPSGIEQNSTIDLFEHYFFQEEPDALVENLNLKTVALFKDISDEPRTVTKIGWHPEGPTKFVGSYCSLR